VLNLQAGEYVILCFVTSPTTQQPHLTMGMLKTMTVEDRNNTASEPSTSVSVHLKDFTFDLPETLPIGPVTIQVTNDGPDAHEFNIMRLEDGKSAGDVLQFLTGEVSGPPPFIPVGGMNGLDVDATGYAELNLLPGKYVAICNIPSPASEGKPHFMLGMIKEFTVGNPATFNFPFGTFVRATDPEFKFIFHADGIWALNRNGSTASTGTFSMDDKTYTETSNDQHCETNVSFTYTFDGKNLTFNYVGDPQDDSCGAERINSFNNVTYVFTPVSLPFPTGKFVRSDRISPVGFIFNADGTWEAKEFTYGMTNAKGTYSVDGDTFTELSNDKTCPPMDFNYTFDGKNLTFTYVGNSEDDAACEGRRNSFDNVTYILSEE